MHVGHDTGHGDVRPIMRRVSYESREAGEVSPFDDDLIYIDLLNLKNFFVFSNYIYFSAKFFYFFFHDLHFRICRPTSERIVGHAAPYPDPREEGHKDHPR